MVNTFISVIGATGEFNRRGSPYFECRCRCGKIWRVSEARLYGGTLVSCGCLQKDATYRTWVTAKHRCMPNYRFHQRYYDRGIHMCSRWLESFFAFLEDMGRKPLGMTLERKDNSCGYEPGNCAWATLAQQARNRRNTKLSVGDVIAIRKREGESQRKLAAEFNVHQSAISRVLNRKRWDIRQSIS